MTLVNRNRWSTAVNNEPSNSSHSSLLTKTDTEKTYDEHTPLIQNTNSTANFQPSSAPAPSILGGLFNQLASLTGGFISKSIETFSATSISAIKVDEGRQKVIDKLFYYKELLTPDAFPVDKINTQRKQPYKIPFYDEAKIKDVNGTKILDAKELIKFFEQHYQLGDMLIHNDKFLLLAVLHNLKLDARENPHVKQEIGEQFAIIKQKLMEIIDNPPSTTELRGGFAMQGKEDLVLAISQELKEQGKTDLQIAEHIAKIQQETIDPIKAKALVDKYSKIEGQQDNRILWASEDINMSFSLAQESAIRNIKLA